MNSSVQNTKPVVVAIDNSLAMIKLLEVSTTSLDVDLMTFTSAKEAWAYLQSNIPALILLSLKLPDKNGLILLTELRQLPIHRETRIVIISSKDYTQDRLSAQELGVDDFIPKPVPTKTITDVIVKYTGDTERI